MVCKFRAVKIRFFFMGNEMLNGMIDENFKLFKLL